MQQVISGARFLALAGSSGQETESRSTLMLVHKAAFPRRIRHFAVVAAGSLAIAAISTTATAQQTPPAAPKPAPEKPAPTKKPWPTLTPVSAGPDEVTH